MSWKSIEMQVALPRTQDAGKIQEQMTKQNQHLQGSLAEIHIRQDEQKRKRVNEFDTNNTVKNKKDSDRSNQSSQDHQRNNQTEDRRLEHPYLGKTIDFNG